jgi:deoxyadenosine/deoxycytidine kinase
MNTNSSKPSVMILIRGLPGSGKSYLATSLKDKIGKNVVVLDPDMTDYESDEYKLHSEKLTKEGVDSSLHAYRFLRAKAYKGILDQKITIWNQPFTNLDIFKKMIERMQEYALEHNRKLLFLIVEVEVEVDVAKKRIEKRKTEGGHGPSDATFNRFLNDYFTFAHLGYSTLTVNGFDNVSDSADSVMKALNALTSQY